jgi:hypothetical protein
MTISDLGNIGEFIASIGVIISLVFVGLQVRANTLALRGESRDRNFGHFIATGHPSLVDRELMQVWLTGLVDPEQLDHVDAERFDRMLVERLLYAQLVFMRGRDVADPHVAEVVGALLAPVLESTAAVTRWQTFRPRPEFRSFVDSLIQSD